MHLKKYSLGAVLKTYECRQVNAGSTAVIYEQNVPSPYVCFVNSVALSWYPDTEVIVYIDGEVFERFRRAIPVTEPYRLDPPVVVRHGIKVVVVNNSSHNHWFEVAFDGVAVEEKN